MINTRMLKMLACPICKERVRYDESAHTLVCLSDRLMFPIRDELPTMLAEEAISLDEHTARSSNVAEAVSSQTPTPSERTPPSR